MKKKLQKLGILAVLSLSVAMNAQANEVLLSANQPMAIAYRIVHQNQNIPPVIGELQTIRVHKNVSVQVPLDNYDKAGVMIVSANGIELPSKANQFDQPRQCSMTTDKTRATGALEFTLSSHTLKCRTYGGVFG